MSDPVTNVEIEDVLSSIRRLVSEDTRSRPAPKPHRQPDRLVLTPALRVKDDGPADDLSRPAGSEDAADGPSPVLLTDPSLDDVKEDAGLVGALDDDSVAGHGDDRIEAFGYPDGDHEWDDPHGVDPHGVDPHGVDSHGVDPHGVDSHGVDPHGLDSRGALPTADATLEAAPDSVEVTAARVLSRLVEQEIAQAFEDSEDEEDEDDEPFDAAPAPAWSDPDEPPFDEPSMAMPATDEPDGAMFDAPEDAVEADVLPWTSLQNEDDTTEPVSQTPQTELERKIAALEEMVARKAEDWDGESPDTGGNAAFVHRPVEVLDWRDIEADSTPGPVKPTEAASAGAKSPAEPWYGEEATTIDEDMLRDMVAEIVRQELQGALGERITRNVRKLVRREIHRVLMSQDFD